MNEVTVELAGKKYKVTQLTIRKNREWRERFDKPIGVILDAATLVGDLAGKKYDQKGALMSDLFVAITARAADIGTLLMDSMEIVLDALYAYAPAIQADKEFVEENAFDDEAVRAFGEVLKLAYPFGQLISLVSQIGPSGDTISQNSVSQNTGDGTTS